MKLNERLSLLKAGYTKDEINALIEEDKADAPEQEAVQNSGELKVDDFVNVVKSLADEVRGMKKAMQTENIENTKIGSEQDSVDRILQSIINPIDKKEEN